MDASPSVIGHQEGEGERRAAAKGNGTEQDVIAVDGAPVNPRKRLANAIDPADLGRRVHPDQYSCISGTSGGHGYASGTHGRYSANYLPARETSGHFLGAMPPKRFLIMFLPIGQDTPKCLKSKGAFTSVSSAKKRLICILHL